MSATAKGFTIPLCGSFLTEAGGLVGSLCFGELSVGSFQLAVGSFQWAVGQWAVIS